MARKVPINRSVLVGLHYPNLVVKTQRLISFVVAKNIKLKIILVDKQRNVNVESH
ncbi:hypothetical protein HMPREF9103_02688 [Lentilactobacillus parafarraginis F0439]|uniref:Uncharacterized protein n=2 Tax=Lentilactobacillus parafarraginis TaxID=390842 RepID=A0A0R1YVI0_9LACO|nr:hypothetical protein HMPREF9103_02688 [Lentilactobacillus parafarraginis F0439]KRM43641.1 hypothetical protein FD47_GL001509 [Lentilactobacillus parafarraginis DSM 18390 = JCM 14109]